MNPERDAIHELCAVDPPPAEILVIEDDADARANLRDILELDDHRVTTVGSAAEALKQADLGRFSAIILDRRLPDSTAEQLMPKLKAANPDAAVIVVTGYSDLQGAIAALRQGATDYILKPLNADVLRTSLGRIAERRRLALAKERSEAAFRHLVEAAECMIVILRPDHSIVYYNPFAEQLTGYSAEEVRGRDYLTLFFPTSTGPLSPTSSLASSPGGPIVASKIRSSAATARAARSSGTHDTCPTTTTAPRFLASATTSLLSRRRKSGRLQSERLAAIGEMVTGLAHESRNALQRCQACLEMLALARPDRPEALDLIGRLQNAQDHLHHLYEDVRSYAAPIRLEKVTCDLRAVWRESWAHLEQARNGKRHSSQSRWMSSTFAASAIRFGSTSFFAICSTTHWPPAPPRRRSTSSAVAAMLHGQPSIRIAVRDMDRAFPWSSDRKFSTPFSRPRPKGPDSGWPSPGESSKPRRSDHHWRWRGPGAVFIITLPTRDTMNRSLKIAIADDELDMRDYFQQILPLLGHHVIAVAKDGRELVEICAATRPDLVITDIKMPDMDGIEAATRIYRNAPIPVILVSAFHDPEFINRAEADHILAYLVKPIKQADLEPAIGIAMRRFEQFQALRKETSDLKQRSKTAS